MSLRQEAPLKIVEDRWFKPFEGVTSLIPPDIEALQKGDSFPIIERPTIFNGNSGKFVLSADAEVSKTNLHPHNKPHLPLGNIDYAKNNENHQVIRIPAIVGALHEVTGRETYDYLRNFHLDLNIKGEFYRTLLVDPDDMDEDYSELDIDGKALAMSCFSFNDSLNMNRGLYLPCDYEKEEETLQAFSRIRARYTRIHI